MKFLGVDYGAKRVGLALSDATGSIAFPLDVVPNDANLISHIQKIAEEKMVYAIVMGDTRSFGGGENTITKDADDFARSLEETGIRVEKIWEAGSSLEASRYAEKGDEHKDDSAAAIILQRFLDTKGGVQ